MTTEIVIMNNLAVAMAADSAVTSYTPQGPKIYNTANKIFALSKYEPIGIMVYQSSDILGIPWETVIKQYREKLIKKTVSSVKIYAEDFIKYL